MGVMLAAMWALYTLACVLVVACFEPLGAGEPLGWWLWGGAVVALVVGFGIDVRLQYAETTKAAPVP